MFCLRVSAASSADSTEECTAAIQCLLNVFHALHPSHAASASAKAALMPLLLPLLVDHLDRAPQCIVAVLALATQQAQLFKANVVSGKKTNEGPSIDHVAIRLAHDSLHSHARISFSLPFCVLLYDRTVLRPFFPSIIVRVCSAA